MPALKTRKLTCEAALKMADECTRAKLRIIAETARLDARIAEMKAKLADKTSEDSAIVDELEPQVVAYLLTNKQSICEQRRKTFQTALSKVGFRKCSDVVIEDASAALDYAMENGYSDLFSRPEPRLSKTAIRKRIRKGEDIPGARIDSDYEPLCEPQKTLVDQAKAGDTSVLGAM